MSTRVLSRRAPYGHRKTGYRTYWTVVDGVPLVVKAEGRDRLWSVGVDVDHVIHDRPYQHRIAAQQKAQAALLAWIASPENWLTFAPRLSAARRKIDEIVASDRWPAIREAYLTILNGATR